MFDFVVVGLKDGQYGTPAKKRWSLYAQGRSGRGLALAGFEK